MGLDFGHSRGLPFEHMFDHHGTGIELSDLGLSGESVEDRAADQVAYEQTCRALADGWVGPDRHVLPDDLESFPLTYLAVVVSAIDRSKLNGHDAVRLMQAEQRLTSAFDAARYASMVEVAFSPPGGPDSKVERSPSEVEYAAMEIATALTLTRRAAEAQLDIALSLHGPLSRVWEAFATGHIGFHKVREFVHKLECLSPEVIDGVLDRTLGSAGDLTTGQLRARLARLVLEADPGGVGHGMAQGLEDRKVVSYPNPDLTGSLGILSSHPSDIAAAMANLEAIAQGLKGAGDTRTMDQLRSDVALDLLRGTQFVAPGKGGRVHVTITAETLERLADTPGSIDGYGPVTAEIARKTVMENIDGEWVFAVTDNGKVVATGTLARRPTEAQQRRIFADYPTCIFPGCRMPARNCDLDHRKPVSQGGPTHNDNVGPLCRHHHMGRHHAPWLLARKPNGDHTWTSPLGHDYVRTRAPPV